MNFRSYLDEFQPTEFRRSSKESLETLFPPSLPLSHIFFEKRKMGSFVPSFLLKFKLVAHVAPRVRVISSPKRFISSRFKFKSFFMNFIQFNSQFSRFSQKSILFFFFFFLFFLFFLSTGRPSLQKNVKIPIVWKFDEICMGN